MARKGQFLYRYDDDDQVVVEWLKAQNNKSVSLTTLINYASQKFGIMDFNKALIQFAVNNDHDADHQGSATMPTKPLVQPEQPTVETAEQGQFSEVNSQSQSVIDSQQAQGIRDFLSGEE